MSKKNLLIFGFVVVIFLAAIFWFWMSSRNTPILKEGDIVSLPAQEPAKVQEYNSATPKNPDITKPVIELPASTNADITLSVFNISISQNGFSPKTITTKSGHDININITAVDGDYDMTIPYMGTRVIVKKGETKQMHFLATTPGTFLYQCENYCPFGQRIEGTLIVTP